MRVTPLCTKIVLIVFASVTLLNIPAVLAQDDTSPFLATWKLLNPQEKQQFMAGYLYGWRDAAKVTDIAITYVKENPTKAVEGLESIRSLYDVSRMSSSAIAQHVDEFFQDSDNRDASLAAAVSYAKSRLR